MVNEQSIAFTQWILYIYNKKTIATNLNNQDLSATEYPQ